VSDDQSGSDLAVQDAGIADEYGAAEVSDIEGDLFDFEEGEVGSDGPDADESDQNDGGVASGSAAAEAHVDIPPPPAPPPPVAPRRPAVSEAGSEASIFGDRSAALNQVDCGAQVGRISFYRDGRFEAFCRRPGHVRCRLTRTSKPNNSLGNEGQGKPVGLLLAWLMCEVPGASLSSKDEHCNPFLVCSIDRARRKAARRQMRDMVGGVQLLQRERALREGEADTEPEDIPMPHKVRL